MQDGNKNEKSMKTAKQSKYRQPGKDSPSKLFGLIFLFNYCIGCSVIVGIFWKNSKIYKYISNGWLVFFIIIFVLKTSKQIN